MYLDDDIDEGANLVIIYVFDNNYASRLVALNHLEAVLKEDIRAEL